MGQGHYKPEASLVGEWVIGSEADIKVARAKMNREFRHRVRGGSVPFWTDGDGRYSAIVQVHADGWFRYIKVKNGRTIRGYSGKAVRSGANKLQLFHNPRVMCAILRLERNHRGVELRSKSGKFFRKTVMK